jgi:O-antigen ligase
MTGSLRAGSYASENRQAALCGRLEPCLKLGQSYSMSTSPRIPSTAFPPSIAMARKTPLESAPAWCFTALLASLYNPAFVFLRLNRYEWSFALTFLLIGLSSVSVRRRYGTWLSTPRLLRLALLTWAVAAGIATINGLLSGNRPYRVAADLAQFLEFGLLVWIAYEVLSRQSQLIVVLRNALVILLAGLCTERVIFALRDWEAIGHWPHVQNIQKAVVSGGRVDAIYSPAPAIVLPVLLAFALVTLKEFRRGPFVLLSAGGILATLSVLLSFKRTLWAAQVVAVGVVALAAIDRRWRRRALFLGPIAALLVSLGLASLLVVLDVDPDRIPLVNRVTYTVEQFRSNSPGVQSRALEYRVTADNLAERPVLGRGFGALYFGLKRGEWEHKHFLHNTWLAVLLRMGLMGFTLVGVFALLIARFLAQGWKNSRNASEKALVYGALAAIAGLLVQSLTMGTLLTHPVTAWAGALLGLTCAVIDGAGPHSAVRNLQSNRGKAA